MIINSICPEVHESVRGRSRHISMLLQVDIPDVGIYEFVMEKLKAQNPNKTALSLAGTDHRVTYGGLIDMTAHVAKGLITSGIREQDVVDKQTKMNFI